MPAKINTVKPATCYDSSSPSSTADANPLELLKRLPDMLKMPYAMNIQTTSMSIESANKTSPPVAVGVKK